jgi:hypothetical protein
MFVPASATASSTSVLLNNFPGLSAATAQALQAGKANVNFNLDEIFGDCFFTPDGETVFLNADDRVSFVPSNESNPTAVASRIDPSTNSFIPIPYAGGITTTHLDQPGAKASVMGPAVDQQDHSKRLAKTPVVPAPSHHIGFVTTSNLLDSKKKRRQRPGERKMSDQQKVERRYVFDGPIISSKRRLSISSNFSLLTLCGNTLFVGSETVSTPRGHGSVRSFCWSLSNNR